MRKIGILKNSQEGVMFSRLLNKNGIKNQVEIVHVDDHYESIIWIYDEDQIEKSEFLLDQFQLEEHDMLSDENLSSDAPAKEVASKFPISLFFIGLCIFLFFLTQFTTPEVTKISKNPLVTIPLTASPVKKALLYDWPAVLDQVSNMISEYGVEPMLYPEELPESGQVQYRRVMAEPVWFGIYPYLLHRDLPFDSKTLFHSIREGEVWRLFTPALLHYDLFHIFFNLLWLAYLGKILEKVLTKGQYLALIFIGAVGTNTFQYLMTGPNFLGYSGVLTTYLGFIWMRQKVAPWEAYPLPKSVITFMAVFVFGMFFLSFLSFLTEYFYDFSIAPGIANTAHVSGALIGALLGTIPYFSSKQSLKVI